MTETLREEQEPDCGVLGRLVWHTSEEGGGPDVGISVGLGGNAMLWAGEITDQRWAEGLPDIADLGDAFGTWLILYGETQTHVLGRLVPDGLAADVLTSALVAALSAAREEAARAERERWAMMADAEGFGDLAEAIRSGETVDQVVATAIRKGEDTSHG